MWVFLSGRLRRWVLMTVMLPVLGLGARKLGEAIEGRRGPNPVSSGLRTASSFTTRGGRFRARSPLTAADRPTHREPRADPPRTAG